MWLITDYDGTLAQKGGMKISEENSLAYKKWNNKNSSVIVSGKLKSEIKPILAQNSLEYDYLIQLNGGQIFDKKNNVIFSNTITKENKNILLDVLSSLRNEYNVLFVTETCRMHFSYNYCKYIHDNPYFKPFAPQSDSVLHTSKDFIENDTIVAVQIFIDPNQFTYLESKLEKNIKNIKISRVTDYLVQINNVNLSKGDAVKYLMNLLGINPNEIVAIGNEPNDVTFIELADNKLMIEEGKTKFPDILNFFSNE